MKKIASILFILSITLSSQAQELTKQKEVGLIFSNLNSFGLSYKFGSSKSLWRINTLLLSGSSNNEVFENQDIKQSSAGVNLTFGKELRKHVTDNFELRYGGDLSFSYNKSKFDFDDKTVSNQDRTNNKTTYNSGINIVIGFNYLINERILLGAEILPGIGYTTGASIITNSANNSETKSDLSGFNYGLSNNGALISLAYRF